MNLSTHQNRISCLEITRPKLISSTSTTSSSSVFVYGPMAPGYSLTVGNAIRRTLLSSIPGCSIVCVSFNDARHMFSTIKHIEEDVYSIVEKLKNIRFKTTSELVSSKTIDINLPKIIDKYRPLSMPFKLTSSMITTDDSILILNDTHICTIHDRDINLTIKLVIEQGVGYIDPNSFAFNSESFQVPHGYIPINNPVNAVRRARVAPTQQTRHGEFTNYELLEIDVETDGSISAHEAICKAIDIQRSIFGSMNSIDEEQEDRSPKKSTLLTKPISELPLRQTIIKRLEDKNITEVGHIVSMTEQELLEIDRLGVAKINEIKAALDECGLSLARSKSKF